MPHIGKKYTWWKAAQTDVFTWNPVLSGRHQIWLSWGCGLSGRSNTTKAVHATDAEYHLDLDGDLETQDDRRLIAIVNQQKLADGSDTPTELVGSSGSKNLWSGLYAAGIHELKRTKTRCCQTGRDFRLQRKPQFGRRHFGITTAIEIGPVDQ